jgi:thioredoxin reductase (NADPH)
VTLFTTEGLAATQTSEATTLEIEVIEGPFVIRDTSQSILVLDNRGSHRLDFLYPALGCRVRSDLATKLGVRATDVGTLIVDQHYRTNVHGIYAIGDVVADLHQLSVAVGHAAVAATAAHNALPIAPR